MADRFLLTPYFIGDPLPGLARVAQPDWARNQPPLPVGAPQEKMGVLNEGVALFVASAIAGGDRPVSVAGDCCTAIGVLAGLQRAGVAPTLLWFDAHGDFNTWETTPSGFLGGMPLAMMVGRGDQAMMEAVGAAAMPEDRVVLADGRDLDPLEAEALAASAVTHIPNVASFDVGRLPGGPLWVHVDVDVITPDEAPAQNYPAPGGPTAAELTSVFERLEAGGRVVAASMSSWNPDLDRDGSTAEVCTQAFMALAP